MIETLYKKMMIPDSCKLGKKVYKKLFLENAKLTASDKDALKNDVESILAVHLQAHHHPHTTL